MTTYTAWKNSIVHASSKVLRTNISISRTRPYAFACTCSMDVKSGAGCVHAYTALLYAGVGCVRDRPYSNDRDEGMIDVVVGDDVENENGVGKSSADIEYRHRDIFRRMEMKYVPAREFLFKAKGRKWVCSWRKTK
ncbi:hypothetical protein RB195_019749 [Necator americanus]|uniref:SWIM-type domain-containing protein n=1 Tax=Necator americanus TaxID=51031 RepID=A0ABR1CHV5_NECAM